MTISVQSQRGLAGLHEPQGAPRVCKELGAESVAKSLREEDYEERNEERSELRYGGFND